MCRSCYAVYFLRQKPMKHENGGTVEEGTVGSSSPRWIRASEIQDRLAVSRSKSYEIIDEIREKNYAPDATIKFGGNVRVREDMFLRWVLEQRDERKKLFGFISDLTNVYSLPSRRRGAEERVIG